MSYVKSSETENYTEIDWLTRHVAGYFWLFEEFPRNVEFEVVGLGKCKIVDTQLAHNFEEAATKVWMVFELNGALMKIEGWKDSYGGSDWDRTFKPVRKKEVVTFEYV